jgi:hypothetical protein
VTKSLAITVAIAPPVQNSVSSPVTPSVPLVTTVSTNTTTSAGGNSVTVTGTNMSGSVITIGGVPAQVTANTSTSVTFTVPAGLTGTLALTITNANGSLTLVNALRVAPAAAVTPPQTAVSATTVFDNFAPGSAVLTKAHRAKLRATIKLAAGMKTMVCIGYTMGPKVLKADAALAKARSQAVCNALRALAPKLNVVQSTGVTETGVGGAVRRAEVYFKG